MKRVTAKSVSTVLIQLAHWIDEEPVEARRRLARGVNDLLDDLTAEDFFGTEGQCDPRGDQRDE